MNLEACLASLERASVLRPKYPDSWYNLGCLLAYLGRHADALHAVNRSLEIHPQYLDASVSRCFLLLELGRLNEAFRELKRLHVRSPDDFSVLFALGTYCMRCGWHDIGVAQLLRAAALRPRLPYVLLQAAAALDTAGRQPEAIEMLYRARVVVESLGVEELTAALPVRTEALSAHQAWQDPCLVRAHILLANFAAGEGDTDATERELRAGCRKYPGHPLLSWHLGRTLIGHGKRDEAERWLGAQTRMDEDCPHAHLELSFLHAEAREPDRAVAALRRAVELRPLFPDFQYHLGTLLRDLDRVDEAIGVFRRVLLIHPGYGHASVQLAGAYLAKGAFGLALEALAASHCADWPEALMISARAHAGAGELVRARADLDRVLALDAGRLDARELITELESRPVASAPA